MGRIDIKETCDMAPPSVGAIDGCVVGGQTEEMEVDESFEWSNLEEELQEKILARLPFVKYFQVPLLSKGWRIISRSQAFHDEVTSISYGWPIFCPVYLSRKRLVGYDVAAQRWQKLFTLSYLPYVPHGDDAMSLCSGAGSLICFARRNQTKEKEMYKQKLKSKPVAADLYSRLMAQSEVDRKMKSEYYHRQGQRPPWHPQSEEFQTRLQNFQLRLQQFCMADTVHDERSEEAQECNAYIEASMCERYGPNHRVDTCFDIYVTNVVTKKWKVLPSRPSMERPDIVQLVVVGTSAYKVILMTLLNQSVDSIRGAFGVQIYDFKTDSWTMRNSRATISRVETNFVKTCVYIESKGVFCIIVEDSDENRTLYEILAYNVEHDLWSRIPHPVAFSNHQFLICELVVCGTEVMLITGRKETDRTADNIDPSLVAMGYTGSERMLIYSLDIDLMSFEVFSKGPPERVFKGTVVDLMVGAGDCVYFGLKSDPSKPFVAFNVRQKLWSPLSPVDKSWLCLVYKTTKFPFQPGLNPYLNLETGRDSSVTQRHSSVVDAGGLPAIAADSAGRGGSASTRPSTAMEDVD